MIETNASALHTESDVEQKFVYPLLTEALGYDASEVWTRTYLAPTDIDKGAGKKFGYYPDYLIYIAGIPLVVVEVKEPTVPAEQGLREARLYALEVNKRYPANQNPISMVLATNGRTILFGRWDDEANTTKCTIDQLVPGQEVYGRFLTELSRQTTYAQVLALRARLTPVKRLRPLALIGGPSRQNESLPPNSFSQELVPILRRYFDPDDDAHAHEIVERAYCASTELTQYNALLEALLKDRIPHQEGVVEIQTTKTKADSFDGLMKRVVDDKKSHADPLILLIGAVGAGKSIFLRRYFEHLMSTDLRSKLIRVTVDFNKASEGLENVESWICERFVEQMVEHFGDGLLAIDNLERIFAPDLARLRRGPLALLKTSDEKMYNVKLSEHLLEWFKDVQRLAFSLIRLYTKDKDFPLVIVFDNVDRRDRNQQLKIFQTVQWMRSKAKFFSILTLRDETYDAYKDQPPLDAFLKPFAFRITPPRFLNVIKRRLELAIEYLVKQADKQQSYELPNGMQIRYPATKLGKYLITIYASIFMQSRKVRLLLEALAGRNTRNTLEMFADLLISGYITDDLIFRLTEGNAKRGVPEWLVIRVLMRTRFRYFSAKSGYIANILDTKEDSPTANNYLLPELLEYLSSRRKESTAYKIEGYQPVTAILVELSKLGFSKDDVVSGLEVLLNRGLITADHQRNKGLKEHDYVKISASGYFHLRYLTAREEYVANIVLDTPINDEALAKNVAGSLDDSRNHSRKRIEPLQVYLSVERDKYRRAFPDAAALSAAPERLEQNINRAIYHHQEGALANAKDDLLEHL